MTAVKPAEIGTRKKTPAYLKKFVHELFDNRCLLCGLRRPLAVAHIDPWPVIRTFVAAMTHISDHKERAFWEFHKPTNVVLLCCNCHALADNRRVTDVTMEQVLEKRDEKMAESRFAKVVRAFVCRELGPVRRRPVNGATLAPLQDWLRDAALNGALEPPYRFFIPNGAELLRVDLVEQEVDFSPDPDPDLPSWNGKSFSGGRTD